MLPVVPGEREGPGPDAGLQAGPGQAALRQGEPQARVQEEEERDNRQEERHGVLRQLYQDREIKVGRWMDGWMDKR